MLLAEVNNLKTKLRTIDVLSVTSVPVGRGVKKGMSCMMSNNESMEMYLETVYLLEQSHGHAHCAEIAKQLGVSKPSVTKAMNQLKSAGLIIKEAYGTINLTDEGKLRSEKIYEQHQLITEFLVSTLSLDIDEASRNACKIEHVISEVMLDSIKSYLAKAETDE